MNGYALKHFINENYQNKTKNDNSKIYLLNEPAQNIDRLKCRQTCRVKQNAS